MQPPLLRRLVAILILVLGVTAIVGVVGYLIDKSAARDDRREGR